MHTERLSMYTEPLRMHTERLSMYTEPLRMHTERLSMCTEPLRMHTERLSMCTEPLRMHTERLSMYTEPLRMHTERLSIYTEPLRIRTERLSMFTNRQVRFLYFGHPMIHDRLPKTILAVLTVSHFLPTIVAIDQEIAAKIIITPKKVIMFSEAFAVMLRSLSNKPSALNSSQFP